MISSMLPHGCLFADRTQIEPREIMALRESVGWKPQTAELWSECLESSLDVVGVLNTKNELVGIGFTAGTVRHAVLCDLTVRPDYQHLGVGQALILKRLNHAEQLGVHFLYVSLAETNPLRPLYEENGFRSTGGELFKSCTR